MMKNLSDIVGTDSEMPMSEDFIKLLKNTDVKIDNMVLLEWEDGDELLIDMQSLARLRQVLRNLKPSTLDKVEKRMLASANGCQKVVNVCWSV